MGPVREVAWARRLAGVAVAGALVACRSPTEIDVQVSTNVPCGAWQGAAVAVGELGPTLETRPAATTSTYCDDTGHLGTVVAIPSGGESANVAFRVVGAVGQSLESCTQDAGSAGCIVARRALNFIPHETLSLAVPLVVACEGIPCDPTTTCVEGQCRPATIPDPAQCANATCGEGALGPADGGATDAATDATLSDGSTFDASSDAPPPDSALTDAGEDVAASPTPATAGCGTSCAVSAGESFDCAIRDGGVECWGQDYNGELGNDEQPAIAAPGPVLVGPGIPLTGARGLVSGEDTSCAFLLDGGVACWGAPSPLGTASPVILAQPAPFLVGATSVSIDDYHMCWISRAGQLLCQCSDPGLCEGAAIDGDGGALISLALPAGAAGSIVEMETTYKFTCVLTADGAVYCLGDNNSFESNPYTGDPANVTTFTRVPLPGDAGALEIGLLIATGCARTAGHVYCWGLDEYGQAGGPASGVNEVLFVDGGPLADAVQLAPGEYHACAIVSLGHVACWGNDDFSELGRGGPPFLDGGGSFTSAADLVVSGGGGALTGVVAAASGFSHTCAKKGDGTVWCWGENDHGEVGQDAAVSAFATPALVP